MFSLNYTSRSDKRISVKTKLFLWIQQNSKLRFVVPLLAKINLAIFHYDKKQRIRYNFKSPHTERYYIHRGAGKDDMMGLFGLYRFVLKTVYAYEKMGYSSFVDFENYMCQYSVERKIDGSNNAWEYYFKQPNNMTSKQAYSGRKIVLSGWTWFKSKRLIKFEKEWDNLSSKDRAEYMLAKCPPQENVIKKINEIFVREFSNHEVLGVFLRGTDYVYRRPIGHPIQPTVEQAKVVIDSFLTKYAIDKIFLVTEDKNIYENVKGQYNEKVFCSDYEFVDFDTQKNAWVRDCFSDDPYERGLRYLIRILLLAKCNYFVGGMASGSEFALDVGSYKEKYVFDMGCY